MITDTLGRPLDRKGNTIYPKLPLATYFANAGLSESDAQQVQAEVTKRAIARLIQKAKTDDAGERFKYLNDAQHRIRVNQDIFAEVLLGMGFSAEELTEVDRGMQLGLVTPDPKRAIAHVWNQAGGRDEVVEVEPLEDRGPDGRELVRLTDVETGEQRIA